MEFSKTVKFVSRPGRFLIYFSDEGSIFETNDVGKYIVLALKANKSIEEIVNGLNKETNADKNRIKADVEQFITLLKSKGILK